ncbi:unnamed protein product, partial [Protopolystoma xenopodis]
MEAAKSLSLSLRNTLGSEENRQSTPLLTKSSLTLGFGEKDPE